MLCFYEKRLYIKGDDSVKVRNIDYSKTIQPTFLYCNIVENSYINGKLSRNLSTIPLSMKAGLNFYEFSNPAYVPIDGYRKNALGGRIGPPSQFLALRAVSE